MKMILRIFITIIVILFGFIALIKFVRNCSWKEAVGIAEEFCKEVKQSYPLCCGNGTRAQEKA